MYFSTKKKGPCQNCEITKSYTIVKPKKSTTKGHQISRHHYEIYTTITNEHRCTQKTKKSKGSLHPLHSFALLFILVLWRSSSKKADFVFPFRIATKQFTRPSANISFRSSGHHKSLIMRKCVPSIDKQKKLKLTHLCREQQVDAWLYKSMWTFFYPIRMGSLLRGRG